MKWLLTTVLEQAGLLDSDGSCTYELYINGSLASSTSCTIRRIRPLFARGSYDDEVLYIAGEIPERMPPLFMLTRDSAFSETLLRVADAVDNLNDWDHRLLEAMAQRKPFQELLAIGVEKLHNPIALFDVSTALIAYAGTLPEGYEDTIWGAVIDRGFAPLTYYAADERERVGKEIFASREPHVFFPRREHGHAHATAMAYVDGRPYAMLSQVDLVAPFTSGQLDLLSHIRDRIEQHAVAMIGSQRHASPIEHCVRMLLDGSHIEESVTRFHLSEMGWHLDATYTLLWCSPLRELNDVELQSLRARLMAVLNDALVLVYHDSVVLLLRGTGAQLDERALSKLSRDHDVCVGISSCFMSFLRVRVAFSQAVAAVDIYGKQHGLAWYDRLYVNRVTDLLRRGAPIEELCFPELLKLASDGSQVQEQLRTLYMYLLCGCNVAKAAKRLYVHRNTLEYRLDRISARIGMDANSLNETDQLRLMLSCLLLLEGSRGDER